jgi:hypothetical protein
VSERPEGGKPKFDWIAQRAACTVPRVFAVLRGEVEEDVKARNALRPADAGYEWSVVDKENAFAVALQTPDFHREVTFVNEDPVILVLDPSGNQLFDISVIFTSQGKCQMKAKEENCEPWQVRRMALEDILFRFV